MAQAMFSLFVGTREEVAARMIDLAKLKKGDVVVDLGAGDGRLVIGSAKANPGVTGLGVDLNPKLVMEAKARAWVEGVDKQVTFLQKNVFDTDLSKVDVIYMWLFPELQRLLRPKILAEARPGTRIVTQMFDMGTWQADAVDSEQASVRMWVVPANIAGNWTWDLKLPGTKKNTYTAIIEQAFQNADAVVRVDNTRRAVREFKVNGDQISFTLNIPLPGMEGSQEHEFVGKAKGNVIEGKARLHRPVKGDGEKFDVAAYPWRATRSAATNYFKPTGLEPVR
ncbi:MAG: methyltransferase domain-containing protein [Burkholderiales bacterium]